MREQKPVYDQRLLPVIYSSIGILRRLGNHLMSSVDRPRDEYLAFYFWCEESNISGHDQGVTRFIPGSRCLLPTPSSPLQSFDTSSGMPTRHVMYDEPGQSTTISLRRDYLIFRHHD